MLRGVYQHKTIHAEEQPDLPEEAEVLLKIVMAPSSDLLSFVSATKTRAVFRGGVFSLKEPLKGPVGSPVLFSYQKLQPLEAFQGILRDVKDDSVTLQHRASEWWG